MRMLRGCSTWGRCPQTPGIHRIGAGMSNGGGWRRPRSFRLLSRRSGCVPAVPYPPLRFFQSGLDHPRRATIFQRTATTPLTCCLTPGVQFMKPQALYSPRRLSLPESLRQIPITPVVFSDPGSMAESWQHGRPVRRNHDQIEDRLRICQQ